MSIAPEEKPLTDPEVRDLAKLWYRLLDVHAPVEALVPLLAETGLEMQFPEATLHGIQEFNNWYDTVTNTFFDEAHLVKVVELTPATGDVKIVVNWQAKRWRPPMANSDRLNFDAFQHWKVIRGAAGGRPVVQTYVVDELRPIEGSDPLEGSVALRPR